MERKKKTMNEKEISKKIGKMLLNKRYAENKTQKEIGDNLQTSFQQIQKYEKGINRVPFPKLVYLFKSLNIKFAELDNLFVDVQLPRELTIQQVKESIEDVIKESKDNVECN
jgi:transcriptional regulator with XRE-family HTH domain